MLRTWAKKLGKTWLKRLGKQLFSGHTRARHASRPTVQLEVEGMEERAVPTVVAFQPLTVYKVSGNTFEWMNNGNMRMNNAVIAHDVTNPQYDTATNDVFFLSGGNLYAYGKFTYYGQSYAAMDIQGVSSYSLSGGEIDINYISHIYGTSGWYSESSPLGHP